MCVVAKPSGVHQQIVLGSLLLCCAAPSLQGADEVTVDKAPESGVEIGLSDCAAHQIRIRGWRNAMHLLDFIDGPHLTQNCMFQESSEETTAMDHM